MANHITISVIGGRPIDAEGKTGAELIEHVVDHWRAAVERVLPDKPDVIVLPEQCDRPVNLNTLDAASVEHFNQTHESAMLEALADIARTHRSYVTYPSTRRLADGAVRNSVQLLDRTGRVVGIYDKVRPTLSEMDQQGIEPGDQMPVFECDFGTVGCAICFDLNFPELRQRLAAQQPDLILFCSMYHGGIVQQQWAYECRAHLASAAANLPANLPSQIYSPQGQLLATSTNYFPFVTTTVNLDCCLAHLDGNWQKLEALKQKYGRAVSITEPGLLGSVLIASETPDRSARQMLDEFEIADLDTYLHRSRQGCQQRRAQPSSQA